MHDIPVQLEQARRQARQAQARLAQQKALVQALSREGRDAARAQRLLRETTLLAELLRDHAAQLEAQARNGFVPAGERAWVGEPQAWNAAAGAKPGTGRLSSRIG